MSRPASSTTATIAGGDIPNTELGFVQLVDTARVSLWVSISGDHECHLLFDVTTGPATRKHSGAAIRCLAALPQASIGRPRRPSPPPGGSHRSRASPSRAGSIRLSLPGDVADPSTTPRQTEYPRVHRVCSTSDSGGRMGYAKQVYRAGSDRSSRNGFGLSERPGVYKGPCR